LSTVWELPKAILFFIFHEPMKRIEMGEMSLVYNMILVHKFKN